MKGRTVLAVLALAAISSFDVEPAGAGQPMPVCEREMIAAASAESMPLGVLYAVALTETEHEKSLQPYALNIEGQTYFEGSAADAVKRFKFARAQGAKLIDVGCMQINYHYHSEHFRSVEEMLEPHRNVTYAAKFLKQLRVREGNWTMAVARYHAGPDNDPAQKRYVCSVIRKMVKTGFGAWTTNSRRFCG